MSRSIQERLPPDQYAQLVRLGAVKPCSPTACAACGAPACPHRSGEDPIHIDLASRGELLPRGGLGDAGNAPIEVTAEEAAFLDQAKDRLARIRAKAEKIGPPGWFDWGASYGEQWGPVQDDLAELLADARRHLEIGSPQMAKFNEGATQINNLLFKIRNESATDQLFRAVIEAFKGNPIALMSYVVRQVKSAGRLGKDTGKAAAEVYGNWLGDLWAWLPWWGKLAIGAAAVGTPIYVVRRVKKEIEW